MKISRPQPATILSIVAIVMASTGSAVAAISYATNAGAVDGRSAVGNGTTLKHAAGKLVATKRHGDEKGKIGQSYLDLSGLARGATGTFGQSVEVADNAAGVPSTIGGIPGLGPLTSTCTDQAEAAGKEDPSTTIAFQNTSGDVVNLSRTIGGGGPDVGAVLNGTQYTFTINGSNTFELQLERKGVNYVAQGVVRQDGKGTPAASCLVYGFALAVAG